MTVPDPTAPTAEDVIATLAASLAMSYGAHVSPPRDGKDWRAAENLVAAIRAMTVEQQADLLGGRVSSRQPCCRCNLPDTPDGEHGVILAARVLGPWQAEP